MDYIIKFFHIIFHLNAYLPAFAAQYGIWVYVLLFLIIFCETGLVVTAIMPGDSLLFAAGAVAATGALNVYALLALLIAAAFLGNTSNYWIGKKLGHLIFRQKESFFFRQSYLDKTHRFFEKYGGKTIIIARFVPIVRTFAPFVAGIGKMSFVKFMIYNFFGAFFWVILLVYGSYLFGNIPIVQKNFSFVILVIIIISILPPIIEYLRTRYKR